LILFERGTMKYHNFNFLVLCGVLLGTVMYPVSAAEVRVAVASNFVAPMERIATLFKKESGHTLKINLGSSGKLSAQIRKGEGFDVFLSTDEETPKRLMQEGLAVGGSRFVYATGRLVLWSVQPDLVDDTGAILNKGSFAKLAIANPRFSPYGIAAQETLTKLTMWNAIQRKLDKGDDLTKTYQLAVTERADLAFIALSQVMREGKVREGSWWLVPSTMHHPLRQSAVLLPGAQDQAAAKAFLAFLKSAKAVAIMRGFGYELP